MKKILGLDLGTNSIGWSLIECDETERKGNIIGAGSRILPMSQDILGDFDSGISKSQTAERTKFRSIRRLRERQLLRRERLHRVLNILNFLPKHYVAEIDFEKNFGQFLEGSEPKINYFLNTETNKFQFLFQYSFDEMVQDFKIKQPHLVSDNKKIPYDWTIYYLRKKALNEKIEKEELAWLILNFNQKRGYYQLRGEDEEVKTTKKEEFYSLRVISVEPTGDKKNDEQWYNIVLENGWIYRRSERISPDWVGTIKDFIVTTELNEDGTVKLNKEGNEKRSFRSPGENDWTLVKKKTEHEIALSGKTVGAYIYDTLLEKPHQKINGKLVRVIERKYYKAELEAILKKQAEFHWEFNSIELLNKCIEELYANNEVHRIGLIEKGLTNLLITDILFYQRPLKSKKSLISNCSFEVRTFIHEGVRKTEPIKCIAKSHPLFQEFRLLQFLQNLRIYQIEKNIDGRLCTDVDVTHDFLKSHQELENLYYWLNDKKEIKEETFFKYPGFNFKKKEAEKYRWNYVQDKLYPCNETRSMIQSKLKNIHNLPKEFLSREKEEALWHILYSVEDKFEIEKALKTFAIKNNLNEDFVENLKKCPPLKKDYGSFSAKAIKKLLPLMRFGQQWDKSQIHPNTLFRIEKITSGEYDSGIRDRVRTKSMHLDNINNFSNLPLWLASYIVYDRHSESADASKWNTPSEIKQIEQHSIRNPIVEQVINETLQVVKSIWNHYGKGEKNYFNEIHIELGREMKNPKDERVRMTKKISENENTNIRIKLLLMEMLNDPDFENVRPYSPNQQEILKIYEEGALNGSNDIPEEILKITKQAQPSKSELLRYKLWLEQKYRSPYTGMIIPLAKLFTSAYEIEHIIPQSRFFDDSFSNKVICEGEINKDKGNSTAYEYIKENRGKKIETSNCKVITLFTIEEYEEHVKVHYANIKGKMKKLLMDDIPDSFIERQMNDTRYISKVVKNLLSNIVREEGELESISKNVIATNGNITSTLKQDWGLNDVWNEIITPRFVRMNELTNSKHFGEWTNKEGKRIFQTQIPIELSKSFSKKRIDHRHHAMDAIVIACTTRSHINYLNNESALGKNNKADKDKSRFDLKHKLCFKKHNDNHNYKWIFYKPWDTITQDTREKLSTTIVSFKQNNRILNKTINKPLKWDLDNGLLTKEPKSQILGDMLVVRKPLHKDTVSGSVKLKLIKTVSLANAIDNWEMIVDKTLKYEIKTMLLAKQNKQYIAKELKEHIIKFWHINLSKIEIFYWDTDNVASRVAIDESFNSDMIKCVTDTGIQKIMLNHLKNYDEVVKSKIIEHPELAFSPDGIDKMNNTLVSLNNGRNHKPVEKVRTYEAKGNKFQLGKTGNKVHKYVEAAKGTNLYFAIYSNTNGKRNYETISLKIIIDRLKENKTPVPEVNQAGYPLLFHLSPNELVYIPEQNENLNRNGLINISKEQTNRIYKVVSFTTTQCFFIQNSIATSIANKVEFSALNKMERGLNGEMIKDLCVKLSIDHLGNVKVAP